MQSRLAIKNRSKDLLRGNWSKAVVLILTDSIISIAELAISSLMVKKVENYIWIFILLLLFLPVSMMMDAGVKFVFLDWVRKGKLPEHWFKQVWQIFYDHRLAGKVIRVGYASIIFKILWGLIFAVPGVIKRFEYSQALYIMKDHYDNNEEVTARHCLKESSFLMDGYKEDFFIFELSYIGWSFLGILPWKIGLLWVNSYENMGLMIFYDDLRKERSLKQNIEFFPDGTSIQDEVTPNNTALTYANVIALCFSFLVMLITIL